MIVAIVIIAVIILTTGIGIIIFNPFAPSPPAVIKVAPNFTLINQDNETVTLSQFRGKVVLIGFIYTHCPDQDFCILLSADMQKIQDRLGDRLGEDVIMLSISFDPNIDTPSVLKLYGDAHNANFEGWQFLTGDNESIAAVISDYGVFVIHDNNNSNNFNFKLNHEVGHTFNAVLVDQQGNIRFFYTNPAFPSLDGAWSVDKAYSHIVSLLV